MAVLDQVIQMQKEGRQNSEILRTLQEQGLSAKEINDAINQAQVKQAMETNNQEPQQQSIMNSKAPAAAPEPQMQAPPTQETPQEDYYTQTPQGYDQNYDAGNYGAGTVDPDTVTEIAQQVVEEGFKNFKKKTGDLCVFKNTTEEKLQIIDERLKRIETTIDKLQHAVIQKIGEFGENASYIRKDLENLHNTTSKLMNPLIDNLNKTSSHKKTSKGKTKR